MNGNAMRVLCNIERIGFRRSAERIAASHRVGVLEMLGERYSAPSRARRELIGLVHGTTGAGLSELARIFVRNHSTIALALAVRERELAGASS